MTKPTLRQAARQTAAAQPTPSTSHGLSSEKTPSQVITLSSVSDSLRGHYVGRMARHGQSCLGNPFSVRQSHGRSADQQRAAVVQACRGYFYHVVVEGMTPCDAAAKAGTKLQVEITSAWKVPTKSQVLEEFIRLTEHVKKTGKLRLKCHCYSSPVQWQGSYNNVCHTEAVASTIMYLIKTKSPSAG